MRKLPWTELKTVYESVDTKIRKKYVVQGGFMAAFFLAAMGIFTKYKISVIFAFLLIMALVMKKYVAVTEHGLEIYYDMKLTFSHQITFWEDMYALTYEDDPKNKNLCILYFTKGERTQRYEFLKADKFKIINLAKNKNSRIKLYDGKKYREEMKKLPK